jgi:hypothetical protein
VELAKAQRAGQSGCLTMAGISYVFTISRVNEICHQFGGSASEISCASLASRNGEVLSCESSHGSTGFDWRELFATDGRKLGQD